MPESSPTEALSFPPAKFCPNCGEKNPMDAVMCWACYTPLSAGKTSRPQPETENWSLIRGGVYAASVLGLLAASGWLPRRYGKWSLAAGLLGIVVPAAACLSDHLREKKSNSQKETDAPKRTRRPQPWLLDPDTICQTGTLGEEEPIVRILNAIVVYAIRDGADAIRLSAGLRGVKVMNHVDDEWIDQMKIPMYIWDPLVELIRFEQGEFAETIKVTQEGKNYDIAVNFETDDLAEHVILRIGQEPAARHAQPHPSSAG